MGMFDGSVESMKRQMKISLVIYAVLDVFWIGVLADRLLHPQQLHGNSIRHLVWQGLLFGVALPAITFWSLYKRTQAPPDEPLHVTPSR